MMARKAKNDLMSKENLQRLRQQASAAGKKGAEARRAKINPNDYVAAYNRAAKAFQRAKTPAERQAAAEQRDAVKGMLGDLGLNVKGEPAGKPGRKPAASTGGGRTLCSSCQADMTAGEKHKGWCPQR